MKRGVNRKKKKKACAEFHGLGTEVRVRSVRLRHVANFEVGQKILRDGGISGNGVISTLMQEFFELGSLKVELQGKIKKNILRIRL